MPPISSKVKINVDLGEGYGNFKAGPDEELVPLIDYANVACGGHAGDPMIMHQTVKACKAHNIAIGAHPGLPDIQGFGRRYIRYDPEELTAIVRYQIGALKAFLDAEDVKLHHVKPHGTLYGMCYQDVEICRAVYAAVPKGTPVFGLAGTLHEQVAAELGLPFFAEAYGDVKYNKDGTLVIDRKKKYVLRDWSLMTGMVTDICPGRGLSMRRRSISLHSWKALQLHQSRARMSICLSRTIL